MVQLRLCLHTQTPLVRLNRPVADGTALESLREGSDHLPSPGGVTRMLRGLSSQLTSSRRVGGLAWVSLAREPARLRWEHGTIDFVSLPDDALARYAAAKGALWDELHDGVPRLGAETIRDGLTPLAAAVGTRTAELHDETPFELLYTHDFQLLAAAQHVPQRVPRVFRWHVPVLPLSTATRALVVHALNAYDAVVVSTRAYARTLRTWGVRTPVHASYPYLDETRHRVVTAEDLAAFEERHGIAADDVVFTVVARMDPIKSHDVAIRALARLRRASPRARLVLVGGGGFSGGRQGLGMSTSNDWRDALETLATTLGIRDRVTFTGGIPDDDLDVAITRARAVILPSAIEGFGLAPVEGWLCGKPAIVSRGAGVAELVRDGENGYLFPPGDDEALADAMARLADDEAHAHELGEEGRRTARACHLRRGADDVWRILEQARAAPRGSRISPRRR